MGMCHFRVSFSILFLSDMYQKKAIFVKQVQVVKCVNKGCFVRLAHQSNFCPLGILFTNYFQFGEKTCGAE